MQPLVAIEGIEHEEPLGSNAPEHAPARSVLRIVCASVLTPVWSSGLTLAVCFALPLCFTPGCQTTPPDPLYPYELYLDPDSVGEIIVAGQVTWPYVFGAAVFCGTLGMALRRSNSFRALWWSYAAIVALMSVPFWMLTLAELWSKPLEGSLLQFSAESAWTMPSIWLSAVTMSTYRQTHSWSSAALWLQLWLAAFATYWFSLFLLANFDETLVGGKVAFLASGALAIGTICQFGITSADNRRPQFALRTLLLTMTAAAVGTAGWLRWGLLGMSINAFICTLFFLGWLELRSCSGHGRNSSTRLAFGATFILIGFLCAAISTFNVVAEAD